MTREQIDISFQQAVRKAEEVDECAAQLKQLQRQLDQTIASLQSVWEGDGANAYLAKCIRMKEKMVAAESDLSRVASVIRRTAQAYYEAEMRALEAAQINSY